MHISQEHILKALRKVQEPDLKSDLVSLNMVKDIKIDGAKVSLTVVLTTPACPLKEVIRKDCVEAIKAETGIKKDPEIHFEAQVTSGKYEGTLLKDVKNIVAVSSGKGGVGKSTVTVNLALALAQSGAKVGLIDADIYGPSIPVMLGAENERPEIIVKNNKNMIVPVERYGIKFISIGLLTPPESAVVWRGPIASTALKQFISDCEWGQLDYLFIDLPPGTGDIHLTLVQTVPVTGAIIVTTPQKVALSDAQKGLAMFLQPQINVTVIGVLENMSYFSPEELPDHRYYIFGKDGGRNLAEKNRVPFLGEIPLVQSIRESGDEGMPAMIRNSADSNSFLKAAEETARQIALINANFTEKRKEQPVG